MSNKTINNVLTPQLTSDAANKAYVDASIANVLPTFSASTLVVTSALGKLQSSGLTIDANNNVSMPAIPTVAGQLQATGLTASSFMLTDLQNNVTSNSGLAPGNLNMNSFGLNNVKAIVMAATSPLIDLSGGVANGNSGQILGLADPSSLTMPVTLNYFNKNVQLDTANFVDLTSAQSVTGQKTLSSPILISPTLYDMNKNLYRRTSHRHFARQSGQRSVALFVEQSANSTKYLFNYYDANAIDAQRLYLDRRHPKHWRRKRRQRIHHSSTHHD